MQQRLSELYRHVSVHATADREHEAAVELLLLVMTADHHVTDDELDEIRHISDDLGWETPTFSFDQYLGEAMAKVRAALGSHSVDALLDDIDARMTNGVLRAGLFSSARSVAGIDHRIDPAEQTLLAQIAARFD
ncbi:MAG: TerB family tellurite resistance protein [Actinomycetota bacterium]